MLFFCLRLQNGGAGELTFWKKYLDKINEEYEVVMRKRQALGSLLTNGRISQSTFEMFNKEMDEVITEIEKQKRAILGKMSDKVKELEEHIRILEKMLANIEIQHVGGEISDEAYQQEMKLLTIGLENAKKELELIKETINKLAAPAKIAEYPTVLAETEAKAVPLEKEIKASEIEAPLTEATTEPKELREIPQETPTPTEATTPAETTGEKESGS